MKNWILGNIWKKKLAVVNKEVGMFKKLGNYLPRHSWVNLHTGFIGPHTDYVDITYDKPNNMNICNKIESHQYNAARAITAVIGGSSKEKLG